jgi:hypothetical protein
LCLLPFLSFSFQNDEIQSTELSCSLLEKNRVTFQLEGESNFHLFYLLFLSEIQNKCEGLHSHLREDIDYRYIYPSDRLNDPEDLTFLRQRIPILFTALEKIGIDSSLQNHLFQALAGIILLGNVEFKPISGSFKKGTNVDDVECCVDESDPLLTSIATLLGKEDVASIFTAKVIQGQSTRCLCLFLISCGVKGGEHRSTRLASQELSLEPMWIP